MTLWVWLFVHLGQWRWVQNIETAVNPNWCVYKYGISTLWYHVLKPESVAKKRKKIAIFSFPLLLHHKTEVSVWAAQYCLVSLLILNSLLNEAASSPKYVHRPTHSPPNAVHMWNVNGKFWRPHFPPVKPQNASASSKIYDVRSFPIRVLLRCSWKQLFYT